ncbi:MAG: ubiquinone/menaquinone biosynthesis methyltransferase [Kiritimatiellaeota bacterium]|nr:ubiquinone/menaquinone biosynthesis methyltransferase [Kiritimatiellota bacterium]
MFNEVPDRYDLINALMTFRLDQMWRRKAAAECLQGHPVNILDLCTGTGDLALMLTERAGRDTRVTALDFSQPMLDVAGRKARQRQASRQLQFILGDAGRLPFPDEAFDVIGIAFAFRNLTFRNPHTATYLAETRRVLKSGGKFVIVETSQPRSAVLRRFFHGYLAAVVAPLGWLVSGHRGAYRYLAWSMRHFYAPDELTALLAGQGFRHIVSRPLLGGVAALHVAFK